MDYENKYNEALKVMESLYNVVRYQSSTDALLTFQTLEKAFPELHESEDERIRKGLIKGLSAMKNIHNRQTFSDDAINIDDAIAWLEKQGEQKHKIQPKFKIGDIIRFKGNETLKGEVESHKIVGYDNELYVFADGTTDLFCEQDLYELVEQKSADKVEHKFHEGEWVVQENIGVYKVIEICESWYEVIDAEDNHYSISFDKEYMCHSWDINKDAKDGDVLVSINPFIFKGFEDKMHPNNPIAYCGIHTSNNFIVYNGKEAWTNHEVHPATKKEADLLFQKMKEAGYKWDAEKKELKKIEQVSAWGEEDEKKIELLINILKVNHPNEYFKVNPENTSTMEAMHTEEFVDWLKSIKPNHWKPSEEQMEALLYALGRGGAYNHEALTKLYNDLKTI